MLYHLYKWLWESSCAHREKLKEEIKRLEKERDVLIQQRDALLKRLAK